MPTGLSSTETRRGPTTAPGYPGGRLGDVRAGLTDTRSLLAFRASSLRGRTRRLATYGVALIVLLTLASAWLPAYLPSGDGRRTDVLSLLPSAMIGILSASYIRRMRRLPVAVTIASWKSQPIRCIRSMAAASVRSCRSASRVRKRRSSGGAPRSATSTVAMPSSARRTS